MKTRLRTNKQRSSYQLDVIDNEEVKTHFFKSLECAINFQDNIIKGLKQCN